MAFFGDLLGIAHVLKRAYDLYEGCAAAPQEIQLAREHIHAMALCLEGVNSDILNNPRSFVHQHTAMAKTRTHSLKVHVGTCERALKRMGKLLGAFQGFKSKHISLWDRFRWSTEGKKEIAECKSDLVFATSLLDMFLNKESLNVLWKLEGMIEKLTRRMAALDLVDVPAAATGRKRPRAVSNVTRTIVVSLVLARLRKVLSTYRRKKTGGAGNKKQHPGTRRPKAAIRTNSGFAKNTKRAHLMNDYASKLAISSPPPPYTPKPSKQRPRTPSPDFHYIPGGSSTSPIPRPIRRSSSMNRLMARMNARIVTPNQASEHYACWRVGIGSTAVGLKTSPEFRAYKRGQAQLRKMGDAFKEASEFDERALTENSKGVKMLLKKRNGEEQAKQGNGNGKGKGKKWYFVGGRVVGRDPGTTGLVSVDKAFVVLVRR
jgi:hypothetical protein